MPNEYVVSDSYAVEVFSIKCHRRKENSENDTNGPEYKNQTSASVVHK